MDHSQEFYPQNEVKNGEKRRLTNKEIRASLLHKLDSNLRILKPQLVKGREDMENPERRPLVTVVVSLWEEDGSMVTSKMFNESLINLREQAGVSSMDLDFIVVANNGGGSNEELGRSAVNLLEGTLEKEFGSSNFQKLTTHNPNQGDDPRVPWEVNIPLSSKRVEGQSRCYLVEQPHNKLNRGKIRALRDISSVLYSEILSGYPPDAVFQMDAETILEWKKSSHTFIKMPLRAMYDALKRRDSVVAITTNDRFEAIDDDTGKPLVLKLPVSHEILSEFINKRGDRENFVSLSGGAILSKPEYYIAGMRAITGVTVGDVAEDIMLTSLLREYSSVFEVENSSKINKLNVVTHMNRFPQSNEAIINQLLRWQRQLRAVDAIFPDSKHEFKKTREYIRLLLKSRSRKIRVNKIKALPDLVRDVKSIPGLVRIVRNNDVADVLEGEPGWTHKSK